MGAEVLNNTLAIGKDLVVKGKIHDPNVSGNLTITGDPATEAKLEIVNSGGTEIYLSGSPIANIASQNTMYILAGTGDTDTADKIHFGSAGTNSQMALINGNLGLGTTTAQAAGSSQLTIKNGTSPGALTADQIYIGAKDSAGTGTDTKSTIQIFLEEAVDATALDAVGTLTTRIPIWVNDVCYWLYLDPV